MKASKFSEAQIAFVLKQAEDGTTIGEVYRQCGSFRPKLVSNPRRANGRCCRK